MLFWHLAGVVLLFRYVFRDPKVDVRFLALGAIAPNIVDKPIGTILMPSLGADRVFGHTLLFSVVIMSITLLATRRGQRRRRWMAVAIGAMLHLVLDAMWASGATLFWPALGWDFAPGITPYWDGFLERELITAQTLVQEVVGLVYLAYLSLAHGLTDKPTRRTFLQDGRLRPVDPTLPV